MIIEYERVTEFATAPTLATKGSAGYDLYSAYDYTVEAQDRLLVLTDLKLNFLTKDYYGRIAPRSGLAISKFIDVGGGVIDADYQGIIAVIIYNFNTTPFQIHRGDKIAQIIFEKIAHPILREVPKITAATTSRGDRGFGSTGINQQNKETIQRAIKDVNQRRRKCASSKIQRAIKVVTRRNKKRALSKIQRAIKVINQKEIPGVKRATKFSDVKQLIV